MTDRSLREQLIQLLRSGNAHATFDDIVKGFPVQLAGVRPEKLPHSGWELLEHIRIAQRDILVFSKSADYPVLKWPEDYWPSSPAPADDQEWAKSVQQCRSDLAEFEALLRDSSRNLFEPFAWGEGQTLLREALLIADHNAYHLGQLMLVRRALGA